MSSAVLAPLASHISGIKRRLMVIGVTIMGTFALTFAYAAQLIEWFKRPFTDDLIFYGPTEALFASIKVSFLAGLVLSSPVILYQVWKFIQPALLPKEQRLGVPLFCLAAGLFALGLVFCNLVILPLVIQFFVSFGMDRALTPQLGVGTYVDFNVKFLVIFGFAFELPLLLSLLARAGILAAKQLATYRRHFALAALVVSAIVTPDATLFTMLLMAVPLIILYEIGIVGARVFGQSGGGVPVASAGQRVH